MREGKPLTCRDSEPEPDVALVRGEPLSFLDVYPTTAELVIEIALTSADVDYRKRKIYAAAGVQEYWIVLPETRCVEVYTVPLGEDYLHRSSHTEPTTMGVKELPTFQLDLATFFPR